MIKRTANFENIPDWFKKTPNWVLFEEIKQPDGSKPKKIPRYVNNPKRTASIDKPATWLGFPTAVAAAEQYGMLLGFAIKPDNGVLFIDIDEGASREIRKTLLSRLPTYQETSHSGGDNCHIIGWYKGPKPIIDGIETYTGDRFCVFTGDQTSETSDINDITDEINTLAKEKFLTFEKPKEERYRPPVGILGPGGREPAMFRYGRSLVTKGLPLEEIKSLVLEYNAKHCVPTRTEDYVLERVQEWYDRPNAIEMQPEGGIDLATSDFGNARRLLNTHYGNLRYNTPSKQWYIWEQSEGRWKQDVVGRIEEMAKEVIRTIQIEAKIMYARMEEEEEKKEKERLKRDADHLNMWANRSQAPARVAACLSLASSEVAVEPAMFDRDFYLWNFVNGTLDLKTHKFLPHDRENLITKNCGYAYDENATCPRWEKNLERVFLDRDDRVEILDYIQRATGYSLTGDTSEQVILLFHGGGNNGKSIIIESLGMAFGDYGGTIAAQSLTTDKSRTVRDDLAVLPGKRLITANENARGSTLDEELIKKLTGGDKIKTRALYGEYFEFYPQLKLIWSFNRAPNIRDMSVAMWRRIKRIPFEREIPESERIKFSLIIEQHREELSGIFNWCLQGLKNYQTDGLKDIPAVRDSTREMKKEQDILAPYFEDSCGIYRPEEHVDDKPTPKEIKEWVSPAKEIYDNYIGWAWENGVRFPLSGPIFARAMKERGFEKVHTRDGNFYRNIKITSRFENPKHYDHE